MSERLKDKNIIVTAAGHGIGKATAIAFHNEGANVTATDINDKTLADLNNEYPRIKINKLDSTDQKSILEFTKNLDRVDVLFNAVGFVHHGTILECEENDWDFSSEGRVRQSKRMRVFADFEKEHGRFVVCDFVCPTKETRKNFEPDLIGVKALRVLY